MARDVDYKKWGWILILLALCWRATRYFLVFPIWGDESFVAVNFYVRDYAGLLKTLEHDMVVPIGVLWSTLAFSDLVGKSELALRAVPFVAGLFSLFIFRRFSWRLFDSRTALAAFAIFAASYYPMRHSAEVKPYAVDLLVALLVIMAAHRVIQQPQNLRSKLVLAMTSSIAMWFSYTSAFVAGGIHGVLFLGALLAKDRRGVTLILCSGLAFSLSFIAMYLTVGQAQQWKLAPAETGQWAAHFPPLSEPLDLPWWLLKAHTGIMFAYPNGARNFGSSATTLLVITGAIAMWRQGRKVTVLMLVSSLPVMFVAAALGKYPYGGSARTTLHLAPMICLLAGKGLITIFEKFLPSKRVDWALKSFCVVFMLLMIGLIAKDLSKPYKSHSDLEYRQFAEWLAESSESDDQWIVYGDFKPNDGPNLRTWGGKAARLRFQLLDKAKGPLRFGVASKDLASTRNGKTWVIALIDFNQSHDFSNSAWQDYQAELIKGMGEPVSITSHSLKSNARIAKVLCFAP